MRFTKKALALATAMALCSMQASAATTEFSVSGQTGSFAISNGTLSSIGQLTGSGNTYNYIGQIFTPATTGSYTFGTQAANFDTVLIFYSGTYNPASPGTNAIALNDDSEGAHLTHGLTHATTCSTSSYCSEITANLTAGTRYYVVTTTYGSNTLVDGTVWFYVIGDMTVVVGAPGVLAAATAMGNRPAYGAAAVIDASPNLLGLFSTLTSDQAMSNAASQTLPVLFGASGLATQGVLSNINRIIQARQASNIGLSSGDDFYGDKNLWIKPFGSWADQNARNGVSGYKAETYGMVGGFDSKLLSNWRLGGAFAYAKSDINGNDPAATQNAKIDFYQLIGYGSYSLDALTDINFQLDVGTNTNKGNRLISFASSVASSDYDSQTAHAGVGIGRIYALSTTTSVTPSVRADYTWIKDNAYSETGAGLLNLNVNSRTAEAFVIGIDGKIAHQLNDQTALTANLGVGYDTINKPATITAAFAGEPGASFVTNGIDPSPWLGRAGVGAIYKTKSGLELTARYDAEYRENFLNQTASIKARWAF